MPRYTDEEHPGIERFESGVVGDYVRKQELDMQEEAEWREREHESVPNWIDTTAREYEGLDEDEEAREEERESAYEIKAF